MLLDHFLCFYTHFVGVSRLKTVANKLREDNRQKQRMFTIFIFQDLGVVYLGSQPSAYTEYKKKDIVWGKRENILEQTYSAGLESYLE